jgi:hypothetical protein
MSKCSQNVDEDKNKSIYYNVLLTGFFTIPVFPPS